MEIFGRAMLDSPVVNLVSKEFMKQSCFYKKTLILVIFDAASFYGHHEYDLGITGMFGGFSNEFYSSYHKLIPKQPGFEQRHQLYQLFHYLNHW